MDRDKLYEAVELEPFLHQVGGHSCVLCFDEHTLCKPLVPREHHFYKTMPPDIRQFTPEYKGVVEVTFQESRDGYMNLVAYPLGENGRRKVASYAGNSPSSGGDTVQSDSDSDSSSSTEHTEQKHKVRIKRSGSIEVSSRSKMTFERVNPLNEDEDSQTCAHNPWSLHLHRRQIDKMKKMPTETGMQKFILLENLASHFSFPCILDLKMGTRQHGDEATEEKRRLHMRKCATSTSRTLGVRICGMQVYQASTSCFLCHDKYYGRQLTVDGFHKTLHQFLHDGVRLRSELLGPIISRLEQLYLTLASQDSFRYYASSLLIMYEGSPSPATPSSLNTPPSSPPQQPYPLSSSTSPSVKGPSSLSRQHVGHEIGTNSQVYVGVERPPADPSVSIAMPTLPSSSQHHAAETSSHHHGRLGGEHLTRLSTEDCVSGVDVRMIDFAHVTHKDFNIGDIVHHGPDKGYLLGLESLLTAFRRLRESQEPS